MYLNHTIENLFRAYRVRINWKLFLSFIVKVKLLPPIGYPTRRSFAYGKEWSDMSNYVIVSIKKSYLVLLYENLSLQVLQIHEAWDASDQTSG